MMHDYDVRRREVSIVTYRVQAENFEGAAVVNLDNVKPLSRTLLVAEVTTMERVVT